MYTPHALTCSHLPGKNLRWMRLEHRCDLCTSITPIGAHTHITRHQAAPSPDQTGGKREGAQAHELRLCTSSHAHTCTHEPKLGPMKLFQKNRQMHLKCVHQCMCLCAQGQGQGKKGENGQTSVWA